MIIEFSEADDSRVRWNSGGEWKSADIDELIAAYERKCGKWGHNIGIGNVALMKCSECGFTYPELLGALIFNFCPNCGAKMERREDETD